MPEALNSPITDKARLTALIAGLCAGISAPFLVGFLRSPFIGLNSAQILLIAILTLSFISGCGAALFSRKELPGREHAMGVSARIGMRAGIWAVLVGGSVLILMATSASHSATSAALDRFHRGQMWLTLAVSLASVLPSVLCGFLGGITGARAIAKKPPIQKNRSAVYTASLVEMAQWEHRGSSSDRLCRATLTSRPTAGCRSTATNSTCC